MITLKMLYTDEHFIGFIDYYIVVLKDYNLYVL